MNLPTFPRTLRLGCIALLALTPLSAQFSQLAATDDGKQVYFTSPLLLLGAPPPDWPFGETRIYLAGAGGVTLFAERGALATCCSGSDGASRPQVTGDGSLIGFTLNDICLPSSDCNFDSIAYEAQVRGKQNLDLGQGELQLSRNGRWALLTLGVNDTVDYGQSTLVDLQTGQRTPVPPPPSYIYFEPTYHTIASDGTMLVQMPGPDPSIPVTGLWKQGQFTPADLSPQVISDDASTLVSVIFEFDPAGRFVSARIVAQDVASKKQTVLFETTDYTQQPAFMAMSNDGRQVLYRVGPGDTLHGSAYLASTVSGQSVPIPLPEGELVTDGTLTGGGDMAFLATTAGRIVKVRFFLESVDSLFPGVPHCDDPYPVAPGALLWLRCNFAGTPASLQGALLLNDVPVPVLATSESEIEVQVPWENHGFFGDTLAINLPSESPFQAAQTIEVDFMAPQFLLADPGQSTVLGLDLIKGDWSGLLTTQPGPGDIVYAYMTGLGAVNGPMQDGEPASLTVPEPIVGAITCRFSPQKTAAQTVFAGLAPGTIGIDQVAFRMPPDAGAAPIDGVSCSYSSPYGGSGWFGGGAAAKTGHHGTNFIFHPRLR